MKRQTEPHQEQHMWQSQYDEHDDGLNETWRGDIHLDAESWRGESDADAWRGDLDAERAEGWGGEQDDESWRSDPDAEAWRGEDHLADWPEESAGPEYWMFKGLEDEP